MNRTLISCFVVLLISTGAKFGFADEGVVIKGKVEFDPAHLNSWDGHELKIPYSEIKAELFERIELPPIPFPENWQNMKPEEQQKWATDFEASDEGNKFIENRDKLIKAAHAFEVKIEKDGRFVVFDVPPGIYGLRGRVDKKIGETTYGFEVFGQIEVQDKMDEVQLDPIQVAVTPLLGTGAVAPPIAVTIQDGKEVITLDNFKDNYLFVSFWITNSPSAEYQKGIQEMFTNLSSKYPLKLLSICVDEDRKTAIQYIDEKELQEGSHAFTDGLEHRTVFDYGIRTIPSFWLIAPDGKISMTQYDFAKAFRLESDLSVIIANRIEGKDLPTPAQPPAADPSVNSDSEDKSSDHAKDSAPDGQ